ncbi:DEAD/DEAH box helicase [Agrobacterium sp. CG674]
MTHVQLARNSVVAKLVNPPREVSSFVSSLLSYEVETNGIGNWSGKSTFYSPGTQTFPAGFAHLVKEELSKIGHYVSDITRPIATPLGPENPIVDEFGNDDPRYDYQMHALRQVEKHGAGIIRVATGGGKSKIAKLIVARFNRMSLFVTTRGILLYQMDEQLKAMGLDTGQIGDGEMKFVRGVNLGMVQTLVQSVEEPSLDAEIRAVVKTNYGTKKGNENISREEIVRLATEKFEKKTKRRNAILKFLALIEVVIGEEAHEAGGSSYFQILKHCKNASIRVALTATPFMRDSAADNMRLMAAFGPVLIDISEKLLIDRGILAKPYFKLVDCEPPKGLHKSSPFERAYTLGYVQGQTMLDAMLIDALEAQKRKLPILVLVARTAHGDNIMEFYRKNGIKIEFLRGENKMKERFAQIARLVSGELDAIVGTNILDVGVDVPAIGLLQRAGGMKAEVQLRQQIGRALRAKKRGPNIAFIADYSINFNNTLRDHANQRYNIIRKTPGFVEGILGANDNFPWHEFDKVAA